MDVMDVMDGPMSWRSPGAKMPMIDSSTHLLVDLSVIYLLLLLYYATLSLSLLLRSHLLLKRIVRSLLYMRIAVIFLLHRSSLLTYC